MSKYLFKSLVLINLIVLFSGCSVSSLKGYKSGTWENLEYPSLLFYNGAKSVVFNTSIDLYKNHFTGLTVLKQFTDSSYRVVFITEMGLKIFDLEILPKTYIVHFVPDWLNKRIFLNTLANDFGLLVRDNFSNSMVLQRYSRTAFTYKPANLNTIYIVEDNYVEEIYQYKGSSKKLRVELFRNYDTVDFIKIEHYNIKLSIQMYNVNEYKKDASE